MIKVNGNEFELNAPLALSIWLIENRIDPLKVAVELNGEIVKRANYAETQINHNDTLEIVTFMGGG
ncbi:MAG: sulfur carrier protein ThiS [Deferribacteraceae bacterium]|jgi:sulfur carrier protein|nr:sulfur carrier protein ThiS [Deferribacteraceae bacterium]